jgi:hypothetical protein
MIKQLVLMAGLTCLLVACKKDDKIMVLRAEINGVENASATGSASRYLDYNGTGDVRYFYVVSGSGPSFNIEAYDSTFYKLKFGFPDFSASYVDNGDDGAARYFDAIDGEFLISDTDRGVISGSFFFNAVNRSDDSDTVHIRNGYYKITLEEYERALK